MQKTKEFNFLKRFLTILITFTILTTTNNILALGEVIYQQNKYKLERMDKSYR